MSADDAVTPSDLRVAAIVYVLTENALHGCVLADGDDEHWYRLGDVQRLVERVDGVKFELRRTSAVAYGRVPRLTGFAQGWGRELIPDELLVDPPDVLVVVPHSILHDVPLHLVESDAGVPLGVLTGVCYCSSMTLFTRCASRNRLRFAASSEPEGPRLPIARNIDATDVIAEDARFHAIADHLAERWPDQFSRRTPGLAIDTTATRRSVKMDCLGIDYWDEVRQPEQACLIAHGHLDPMNHRYSGLLVDGYRGMTMSRSWPLYGRYYEFPDRPLRPAPLHHGLRTRDGMFMTTELLTAAEITLEGECRLDLLALLGCSAGAGRILDGDEPASLAETFLHAGCVSVIGASWDADVEATRAWIAHFMEAWIDRRQPKAVAARDALKSLREEGNGGERTGVYTLRGDWL